eukprot:jgi/Psemu1/322148/estExt_fgenesh1_pg.C_210002
MRIKPVVVYSAKRYGQENRHPRRTRRNLTSSRFFLLVGIGLFLALYVELSVLLPQIDDLAFQPSVLGPSNFKRYTPEEISENSPMGYIHIGKTAGSTISLLLRNGCHSFVPKPCRLVPNETVVSKLVEHYYHVPDFHTLRESNDKSFLISVRDVYDRAVSSFLYMHPGNKEFYAATQNLSESQLNKRKDAIAYSCFPTLESFASFLPRGSSSPADCNYRVPKYLVWINNRDCAALGCAVIHGQIRFFNHLFFNLRRIFFSEEFLPPDSQRKIFVLRKEFLWRDWSRVNHMFGQEGETFNPTDDSLNIRNTTDMDVPVTRDISEEGRRKLCLALEREYVSYFQILKRAENITPADFEASRRIAVRNCPYLSFLSTLIFA